MAGKNGGARPGAGRKPKSDEATLMATMDRFIAPDEFWEIVSGAVRSGDQSSQRLWANYRFGAPKQEIKQDSTIHVIEEYGDNSFTAPSRQAKTDH